MQSSGADAGSPLIPAAFLCPCPATAADRYLSLVRTQRRITWPGGGFVYKRKQNNKGEEVGGIVPHVTLKSIANNEPPEEEVLVDRPERSNADHSRHRAVLRRGDDSHAARLGTRPSQRPMRRATEADGSFVDRMIEILRKSPVLRLEGNNTVTLKNVRPPAKSLLSPRRW